MFKKSFFDAVSIASMERMHSQMIAWIMSEDCHAISRDSKEEILAGLCGSPKQELGRLEDGGCQTEWHHIDVVIEMAKSVVFIENKIKSSQSAGQLSHYDVVIDKHEILQGRLAHKVLLSLVRERSAVGQWREVPYSLLVSLLESAALTTESNEDVTIFKTYIASLRRLTDIVERFRENPDRFGNVFTEGSLSRAEKSGLPRCSSPECQYVRDMQLETVLQRLYLQEIADRIRPRAELMLISETRGVALLDIKTPEDLEPVEEGGYTFDWGIQFQGKSVKIQFELGWHACGDRKAELAGMRAYMNNNVFGRVDSFARQPRIAASWQFNRPAAASGSAYCSVSRPKGALRWGEALDVATESYRASLHEALSVAAELRDYLSRTRPVR